MNWNRLPPTVALSVIAPALLFVPQVGATPPLAPAAAAVPMGWSGALTMSSSTTTQGGNVKAVEVTNGTIAPGNATAGARSSADRPTLPSWGWVSSQQYVAADGEQRRPVWFDGQGLSPVAVSPDGASVAWIGRTVPDQVDLMVTTPLGSRSVFPNDNYMQQISWSPDGARVAVQGINFGRRATSSSIWVVTIDGSQPVYELTGPAGRYRAVEWTPDGSALAFLRGGNDVYVHDLATQTNRRLTHQCTWTHPDPATATNEDAGCPSTAVFMQSLDWSPDGSRVLVSDPRGILTLDPATGVLSRLATFDHFIESALWTPDGAGIAIGFYERDSALMPAGGGALVPFGLSSIRSFQACPGACPVFGAPRKAARIAITSQRTRKGIRIAGLVKPGAGDAVGPYKRPPTADVVVRAKVGARWRKVAKIRDVRVRASSIAVRVAIPTRASACRVKLAYEGDWVRLPAKGTKSFAC